MRELVTQIEQLSVDARSMLLALAEDTSYERRAAELAMTEWQSRSGWTQHELGRQFPRSAGYVEAILETAQPGGYPFVARTAVVDSLRCILIDGLAPALPSGVVPILRGPIDDVFTAIHPGRSGTSQRL